MDRYTINDFSLDNDHLLLYETLFHNANGYIGVRSGFEEGYPENYRSIRGQYINGFYDYVSMPQAEKLHGLVEEKQTMLNVVDTQGIRIEIDDEEFSMFDGTVLASSRTVDMKNGYSERFVKWESPKGKQVEICIRRLASFIHLPLFFIDYSVKALNFSGDVFFESSHKSSVSNFFDPTDPRVADEFFQHIYVTETELDNGISYATANTSKSGLSLTTAVKNELPNGKHITFVESEYEVLERMVVDVAEGETEHFYKYTIMCDSVRYDYTKDAARKKMQEVLQMKVKDIYAGQTKYMADFWEDASMEIEGDSELDIAVHYNLYQLIQSVGKDPYSNIAAKGLSGEGYEGHYFWDTEMYMQPFFTLTSRDIAKNLIRYRYTTLDHAKANASLLGHGKGASYPWRTIMGKECSGYFPSGSAQYHVNGDIAYSIIQYYLTTKDLNLMQECGLEILIETSRLWMDLGNYHKGRFNLNEVTGPDEYTCLVNNNYYTNALAKYGLEWTCKLYDLLEENQMTKEISDRTGITKEELAEFKEASLKMYLPYDKELGINPQDDGFLQKKRWEVKDIPDHMRPLLLHYHPMYLYRYQVCKQADTVLSHFILEDMQEETTVRNSFDYYEKITTNDSSLSTCIFSIVASKLGLYEKAYDYFGESAKMDLFNTHKNTKDGIHTANMGGTYMAIVYGFGGLRIKESGLYIFPTLPKTWERFRFRFSYEDAKLEVRVSKEECSVILLEGKGKQIHIYDQVFDLVDEVTLANLS